MGFFSGVLFTLAVVLFIIAIVAWRLHRKGAVGFAILYSKEVIGLDASADHFDPGREAGLLDHIADIERSRKKSNE